MDGRTRSLRHIVLIALVALVAMALCAADPASAASKRPDRVTVIKATASYDSITLNWKAAARADKYIIYRSDSKYGLYNEIDSVTTTTYTDEQLQTGKAMWYKVRSLNDGVRARKSPRISAVPSLEAPRLTRKATGEGIYLTVDKVAGADGYVIYRDGKSLGAQNKTTYLDDDVYAEKKHRYKAVAYRFIAGKKVVASPFSREVTAVRPSLSLKVNGVGEIEDMHEGEEFELKGKVTSNTTIQKVAIGVTDKESGEWVEGFRFLATDLDAMEFEVAEAAEKVDFSELPQGEYYFRIDATLKAGSEKTLLNREFAVTQPPGGEMIAEQAVKCAWPYGTPRSKYKYRSGKRTDAYTQALSDAYGSRSSWGAQTRAGASCDVFVGTVVRSSGYDRGFPRGLDDVEGYCSKHTDKWQDLGAAGESELQPGDVIFQIFKSGVGHVSIYLGDNRVANAHYMSKTYGVIEKYSSKVRSKSGCKKYHVYRPIQ